MSLFAEVPGAGGGAAGGAPQMRAHQRERELAGQEFVVGKPRPGQAFRQTGRRVPPAGADAQRLGEGRKAFARNPARVLPFGQVRHACERGVDRPCALIEAEPLGQRDRPARPAAASPKLGFVDDAVGMHHLQHVVVERGRARHVSPLADRQQLLQVILARIEIRQSEIAGLVAGVDLIGRARPVRRRRPVPIDGDRDGDDGVGHARRAISAARGGRSRRSAGGTGDRRRAPSSSRPSSRR